MKRLDQAERESEGRSAGGLPAGALGACLIALLAACGSGGHRQPRACQKDSDCGSGAICLASACAANSAPSASIAGAPAAPLAAGDQLILDGAASSDPDPGDAVASYAWTVTGGDCAAAPATSAQPRLDAVFACLGSYTVELVVTDSHGRASLPATLKVAVAATATGTGAGTGGGSNPSPSTDLPPPTVVAGDDLAVDHQCQGTPLSCTPMGEDGSKVLWLTAAGRDATGGPVSYHWSYEPPLELNGQPAPKVEFLSGTDAAQVEVRISTAGTPLSGAWRFFVTVTDARNKKARDELVVTVKDRPVLVSGGEPLTLAHRYDAASQRYVAEGTAPVRFTEPDGDAVQISSSREASRETGCALAAAPAAGGMSFRLDCPTLAELVGDEMKHALVFSGTDPAGNTASARFALTVLDQRPVVSSSQASAAIAPTHRYDAASRRYAAEFTADLAWSDPDGDPTTLTWTHEADRSNGCTLSPAMANSRATLRLECADPGELLGGDMQHTVVLTVSDAAGQSAAVRFRVAPQNLPPAISQGTSQSVGHQYDASRQRYVASFTAPVAWSDPDGDPLTVTWRDEPTQPSGCVLGAEVDAGGAAQVRLECADPLELLGGYVVHTATCTVADPAGRTATARFPMAIGNRPPLVTGPALLTFDHGVDVPGAAQSYRVQGSHAFQVVDPDGDPVASDVQVEVDTAWAPHATASATGGAFLAEVPVAWPGELRRADDSSPFGLLATARDPWQAAQARTAVRVKDRAPLLTTGSPALVPVAHRYDGAGYRSDPAIASGVWVDPDGDPLQAAPTSSGLCTRLGVVASGAGYQVTAACDLAYAVAPGGAPPLASLVQQHAISFVVQDPWGQGGAGATTVSVLDRAPSVSLAFRACQPRYVTCKMYDFDAKRYDIWTESGASLLTGQPVGSDPDGDPVQVTWRASQPDLFSGLANPTCYPVQNVTATCASGSACSVQQMAGCEAHMADGNCQVGVAGTAGVEITDGVMGMSTTAAIPTCL